MPTVLIWRPKKDDLTGRGSFKNNFGHVALKTDKYLISFCAENGLRDGSYIEQFVDGVSNYIVLGVKGTISLNIDPEYEDPIEYPIDATITNEDINSVYEEILNYNRINPVEATIKKGEELDKKRQEYDRLPPEEAENVEKPELPVKLLPKTEYSLRSVLVSGKEDEPFYHKSQTCVTFTFNLIQTAWLKRHPDQPIPVSNPVELIADLPLQNKFFYKVSWFELEVVRKHLKTDIAVTRNTSFSWPKKSAIYLVLVIACVFIPILFIFSYFFPVFRYPTFFFVCIYFTFDFEMIHFIAILLLTLLSNTYPVGVVACTILGVFYYWGKGMLEELRSGELQITFESSVVFCIQIFKEYVIPFVENRR